MFMRVKTQTETGNRSGKSTKNRNITTQTNTKYTNNTNEKYPVAFLGSWVVKAQTKLRKRGGRARKISTRQNANDKITHTGKKFFWSNVAEKFHGIAAFRDAQVQ
jgi:hypothetical protein